jgi:hypothetical protein
MDSSAVFRLFRWFVLYLCLRTSFTYASLQEKLFGGAEAPTTRAVLLESCAFADAYETSPTFLYAPGLLLRCSSSTTSLQPALSFFRLDLMKKLEDTRCVAFCQTTIADEL